MLFRSVRRFASSGFLEIRACRAWICCECRRQALIGKSVRSCWHSSLGFLLSVSMFVVDELTAYSFLKANKQYNFSCVAADIIVVTH